MMGRGRMDPSAQGRPRSHRRRATTRLRAMAMGLGLGAVALGGCQAGPERQAVAQVAGSGAATATPGAAERETGESAAARGLEVGVRRVWAGTADPAGSPSPDGRYLARTDWSTGDVAVLDLATGSLHHLTGKGGWESSGDYAWTPTFSPTGDQVAYIWWNGRARRFEVRVLSVSVGPREAVRGSESRLVTTASPGLRPYHLHGWSPDGELVATLARPGPSLALGLISVEDGDVRILESFDWRGPHAAVSPDGRFIVYDLPTEPHTARRDIYLLDLESSRKATLVDTEASEVILGWTSGGDLIYGRQEAAERSVWRLPMAHGAPAGEAEFLHEGVAGRVVPIGFAGDVLYFGLSVEAPSYGVAPLDLERRRVLGPPTPFDSPFDGRTDAWDWSSDGRHYAVVVRGTDPGSGFHVLIRSTEGTPVGNPIHGEGAADRIRWVPGKRTLVLYGHDGANRPSIRALDLASGEFRTLRRFDHESEALGGGIAVGTDGSEVYFRLADPDASMTSPPAGAIMAVDVESGSERRVQGVRGRGGLAVSPGGEMLAYFDRDPDTRENLVLTTPVGGGRTREVLRAPSTLSLTGLNWTPDERALLFQSGEPGAQGTELRWVSAAGGPSVVMVAAPMVRGEARLHPDGRSIAFVSGENRSEIWAMGGVARAGTSSSAPGGGER